MSERSTVEPETGLRPASLECLPRIDELDRLEARRQALGPRFVRRNVFLAAFSGTTVASLIPVLSDYTPLEYGLPWFVLGVVALFGARSVTALLRGRTERREIDERLAVLRPEVNALRIRPESGG